MDDNNPQFFDVEYEIEKRFMLGFKSIFEKDKRFSYNKNQKETGLVISLEYPDNLDTPLKVPHLIISNVSFQGNLHNTLGYNFAGDTTWNGMVNGAQKYAYTFPYSATMLCVGPQSVSKDLANKLAWYLMYGSVGYLSEGLDLQFQNVSKGACSPSKQYPDKLFNTPVQVQGVLYWMPAKGPEQIWALNDIDKPLTGIKLKFN